MVDFHLRLNFAEASKMKLSGENPNQKIQREKQTNNWYKEKSNLIKNRVKVNAN